MDFYHDNGDTYRPTFSDMYTPHKTKIMEINGMPTDFCSNRESKLFIDRILSHINTY